LTALKNKIKRKRGNAATSKRKGTATDRAAPRSSYKISEKEELRIKKEALQRFRDEYEKSLQQKIKRHKAGRPTKYNEEKVIAMIEAFTETLEIRNFFSFCSFESLADFMGLHRSTLYNWMAKYPKLKEAMELFEQKRNALFYAFVPILTPGSWIFLAKNWLGMTDRQITEIDTQGSLVQYISHMPVPRSVKKKAKEKEKDPLPSEEYLD